MDGTDAERTGGPGTAPGARRIPARAWEARQVAQAVLQEAEEDARRIREEAGREVEAARAAAVVAGHSEGLARAAAEICLAASDRDRLLAGCAEELLGLASEMASRILAREVRAGEDALRTASRALEELRAVHRVTVRASPGDAQEVREGRSWHGRWGAGLRVVPDPSLGCGEVVVEGDGAVVDGRFPAQIGELRRAIAAAGGSGS